MSSVNHLPITVVWKSPPVTVTNITDTSTLNYYVSYKNRESKTTRQIQSSTEQASLNLKANTRYEIKVKSFKAFNSSVAGSWSDSLTIKTNESGKSCTRNRLSSDQYSKQYVSSLLVQGSLCYLYVRTDEKRGKVAQAKSRDSLPN